MALDYVPIIVLVLTISVLSKCFNLRWLSDTTWIFSIELWYSYFTLSVACQWYPWYCIWPSSNPIELRQEWQISAKRDSKQFVQKGFFSLKKDCYILYSFKPIQPSEKCFLYFKRIKKWIFDRIVDSPHDISLST